MSSEGDSLTIDEAKDLLRNKWDITLHDKTRLKPGVAALLAKHPGPLNLYSLKELSTDDARSLAEHRGRLHLRDLSSICDKTLAALAKHEGPLIIQAPNELSEAQAEALGRHRGSLRLQGLQHLAASVAHLLAQHQGPLDLDDVRTLSFPTAEALSKHKGQLSLLQVSEVSDEVAAMLTKHQGAVVIFPLAEMSDKARGLLKKHRERFCKKMGLPVGREISALTGTFKPGPADEEGGRSYIYYPRLAHSKAVPVRIRCRSERAGVDEHPDKIPDWFDSQLSKLGECIERCSKIPPGEPDALHILDAEVLINVDSKKPAFHRIDIMVVDEDGVYWEVCVHGPSFPGEFYIECWGGGHLQGADYLKHLPLNHSIFDSTLEGLKWWQRNTVERARKKTTNDPSPQSTTRT